jgi:diaminohydroxyphosphoribosylaminopyrimidine deaminase/5-amino-6-(5-phosphoribosylamino)uracil reductase
MHTATKAIARVNKNFIVAPLGSEGRSHLLSLNLLSKASPEQYNRTMKLSPVEAMKMAINEAARGAPYVSPNPMVGSIVVDAQGEWLASGCHEYFGGPHAEVNALKNLSREQLKGATLFVTLEPCAHEGKTPSCARMLATLPLKKVVYGLVDPNPLVAGQGAKIVTEAGIATELFSEAHPEMKDDLEEVCEAFLWNYRQKKVFVTLKIAQSLDGQIALNNGESKWITNELSREHAHWIRACHDAVLVGRGTIEKDNPSLDIRHPQIQKINKVVVIDPSGGLLDEASQMKLMRTHATENLFWCVGEKRGAGASSKFAQVCQIKENADGSLHLASLLQALWDQGLRSVMVEGGAYTASQFLKSQLVQRICLFQAPTILGAGGARSWTEGLEIKTMKDQIRLHHVKTQIFGDNLFITGRLP